MFDHFWVFFMIFVIFVDLRCVQQAEFTIRRDRKNHIFDTFWPTFARKKRYFYPEKSTFFQNFRKFFVIFWYRHKCSNCRAVFSKIFSFLKKIVKNLEKRVFCSSYFNRYFEKFSSFCVKKHEKHDFSEFGEGGGYLGHTIHRK